MAEEYKSGTSDLMQFLQTQEKKRVWFITSSGVVSGTLVYVPNHPRDVLKMIDVTKYTPGKKPERQKEASLNVDQVFSWGSGTPNFATQL